MSDNADVAARAKARRRARYEALKADPVSYAAHLKKCRDRQQRRSDNDPTVKAKNVENVRRWRGANKENREKTRSYNRKSYEQNADKWIATKREKRRLLRCPAAQLLTTEELAAARRRRNKPQKDNWRKQNWDANGPTWTAKCAIRRATGLMASEMPSDLVEAKAGEYRIRSLLRQLRLETTDPI